MKCKQQRLLSLPSLLKPFLYTAQNLSQEIMVLDSIVGRDLNFKLSSEQLFSCYKELKKEQTRTVRFQVLMAASMKIAVFWVVASAMWQQAPLKRR
jgi:hypothetical protein